MMNNNLNLTVFTSKISISRNITAWNSALWVKGSTSVKKDVLKLQDLDSY